MKRANLAILLIISVVTLSLSVFLFWKGLQAGFNYPAKDLNNVEVAVEEKTDSSEVLGEEEEIATGSAQIDMEGREVAQVVSVVDGDTIEVAIGGEKKKVRYVGVDTPETVDPRRPIGCFGKEASAENKRLVAQKTVFMEKDISETDKYGRLLRLIYIKLSDGSYLFVNDYLIRQGYAYSVTYPPDVKFTERFLQAQKEAKDNRRGLWGSCH